MPEAVPQEITKSPKGVKRLIKSLMSTISILLHTSPQEIASLIPELVGVLKIFVKSDTAVIAFAGPMQSIILSMTEGFATAAPEITIQLLDICFQVGWRHHFFPERIHNTLSEYMQNKELAYEPQKVDNDYVEHQIDLSLVMHKTMQSIFLLTTKLDKDPQKQAVNYILQLMEAEITSHNSSIKGQSVILAELLRWNCSGSLERYTNCPIDPSKGSLWLMD